MKFTHAALLALTLALPATGALASDRSVPSDTADKIRATLTEQGYEVRKIKMEDGMYEAYVIKDGMKQEIYLDADLKIVRSKDND
ncbi:PepSY domain-containing protein [Pseudodonghicola flavimaris]|uniref:PepSY domain-containing protein n=1 Tax=Pseudodonghicola flavimaris TaxID=3050036 RepID=A0ABT7EYZ2_9RHOB|nr:PepSY domain-containing protein [Pseudodonghicola flavimaris]MDK3017565.1 PepSY domain-containing protein [Pseudodonghicola flavimaris]